MPGTVRLVGAATVLVAALTGVSAPLTATPAVAADVHCPPGLGIGLTEVPKALANDPRAHRYIIDFVKPGTTFHRKVVICNGDPRQIHASLFGDGATISDGTFQLEDTPGQDAISQWVTVTPNEIDLGPGQSQVVTATVAVPNDAPGGEFYGGVVAARPPSGTGIAVAARVAVRVYLAVGKGGLPPTSFTIDTLTAGRGADGSPYVQAQVHNTGKRAIDLDGTLRLAKGPGGLSAGPFPAKLGTTLGPGQTEPVIVPLDKALPAGPWRARIDLQSGLTKRAAEGTITFPSGSNTKAAPVKAKSIPLTKNRDVVVPIAIGLLLAALILFFLILWRRRRRDEDEVQPAAA